MRDIARSGGGRCVSSDGPVGGAVATSSQTFTSIGQSIDGRMGHSRGRTRTHLTKHLLHLAVTGSGTNTTVQGATPGSTPIRPSGATTPLWAPGRQSANGHRQDQGVDSHQNGLPYDYGRSRNPAGTAHGSPAPGAASLQGKPTKLKGTALGFQLPGRYGAVAKASRERPGHGHASSSRQSRPMRCSKMGFLHGGGGRTRVSSTVGGLNFEPGYVRECPATSSPGRPERGTTTCSTTGTCRSRSVDPTPSAPGRLRLRLGDRPQWMISCPLQQKPPNGRPGSGASRRRSVLPQSGVCDDPPTRPPRLQAATSGLLPDGFVGPENLGCSPQAPDDRSTRVRRNCLHDIRPSSPAPRTSTKYPWLETARYTLVDGIGSPQWAGGTERQKLDRLLDRVIGEPMSLFGVRSLADVGALLYTLLQSSRRCWSPKACSI